MGKLIHGNESFGYAPINVTGDSISFGAPIMMSGMVSANAEVSQESTPIYADNTVYASLMGAKVRSLTINFRALTEDYSTYMGYHINANGMLTDTGEHKNHCVFFESNETDTDTGKETKTLHYFYSVKAATPSVETKTDEESVEAAELEVSYKAQASDFVVDDKGTKVQYGYITRTEENKAVYDTFKTAVLLPTTAMQ